MEIRKNAFVSEPPKRSPKALLPSYQIIYTTLHIIHYLKVDYGATKFIWIPCCKIFC